MNKLRFTYGTAPGNQQPQSIGGETSKREYLLFRPSVCAALNTAVQLLCPIIIVRLLAILKGVRT